MTSEIGALLLGDARLPTGGHAHSSGLEPALAAGMGAEDIPNYMESRLRTVGLVEAAAAVCARRCAVDDPSRLRDVQDALAARTPSAPLRHASGMLGRGLARLATRLWPQHPAVPELNAFADAPLRPIALGVVAAAMALDDTRTARSCLYDDAQTVAAAALKLLPVDPADTVAWLLDVSPVIEEVAGEALGCAEISTLPAHTAPLVEQWSLDHDATTRRIFVA
ncbi:MAG TPA: hypothetical protein H9902_14945 [Candidatus Stackebrandtia faecavium]|nr:hypothetical protein [Candidatus Stackebrandtia faecavium]